jgi:hypothetical protein
MPNWCTNDLELTHPDHAMLERAKAAFDEGRFLDEFIPCPEPLRDTMAGSIGRHDTLSNYKADLLIEQERLNVKYYGHKNWYEWCIATWGTKWDVGSNEGGFSSFSGIDDNVLTLSFESAWSPPTKAYERLEELGFGVKAKYFEPGVGFCGEWVNGMDEEYALDDAPKHLDEFYGISSMLAELED